MSSFRSLSALVWILAKTDFKLRYQGSVLGFLWALLKPLLLFLVLNLVFSQLFAEGVSYYSLQLLTGIILWNFFAEGSMVGLNSLAQKAHLLTKMVVPKGALILGAVLQAVFSFLINLFILVIALLALQVPVDLWQMLLFLFYCGLAVLFVIAFSFFSAPLFIRFRDLNQIWEVLLLVGFYAAPIIYPFSIMPEWLRPWLYLNPMTFLIQQSKQVVFVGELGRIDHHLFYLGVLFAFLAFGYLLFKRYESRIVELL